MADSVHIFNVITRRFSNEVAIQQALTVLILPLVWAFFHAVKVLFSTPFSALSDRIGRKKVILIGWGIYAFVYAGFAFLDTIPARVQPPAIGGLFTIYSLYYAFTEGAERAMVSDLSAAETRGSAYGLYHLAVGLGTLPASIIFGIIYSSFGVSGGRIAFITGSVLAFSSMVLLGLLVKEKTQACK